MKTQKQSTILLTLLLLLAAGCSSTNRKPVTEETEKAVTKEASPETVTKEKLPQSKTIPAAEWKGRSFVLLEKMRFFRKFGYQLYTSALLEEDTSQENSQYLLDNRRIKYSVFSGKTIKVIDVKKMKDGNYLVTFECTDPDIKLYGKTKNGSIEGISFLNDIISAGKRWLGKEVYSRRRIIQKYDTASGKFTREKVSVLKPLKILSVTPGMSPMPPKSVWLHVETKDNMSGIIPLHFSWTNVPVSKRKDFIPWKEDIFESPPDALYNWPAETWKIIDEHKIFTGMTSDQVKMSWGEPDKEEVIKSGENIEKVIMSYEKGMLVFEGDTLVDRE